MDLRGFTAKTDVISRTFSVGEKKQEGFYKSALEQPPWLT
jgi:hypothetical protein